VELEPPKVLFSDDAFLDGSSSVGVDMTSSFVIASDRPWNNRLAEDLARETTLEFHLIADSKGLSMNALDNISPEIVFFPHWSYKIDRSIYEKYECIVFHMTDLPFGRGGSPLQNLILGGHTTTKISALKCGAEIDGGPIYAKYELGLDGSAREIFERANLVVKEMIIDIVYNRPVPVDQIGEITRFTRRRPEESRLAEERSLNAVYDKIRMLDADGYPHAFFDFNGLRFELSGAVLDGDDVRASVRIYSIDELREGEQAK